MEPLDPIDPILLDNIKNNYLRLDTLFLNQEIARIKAEREKLITELVITVHRLNFVDRIIKDREKNRAHDFS